MRRLPANAYSEDSKNKTANDLPLPYLKVIKGIWRHQVLLHAGNDALKLLIKYLLNVGQLVAH